MSDVAEALANRATLLGVDLPQAACPLLERYFALLARWNRTVNLTALPVEDASPTAIDRLLLEPAAAAGHVPPDCHDWIDLGSGGGSPAIPLKVLRPALSLVMVEARSRKVAFLREAVRELGLDRTRAESIRFEEMLGSTLPWAATADLVTARAVKADPTFVALVEMLLRPGGELMLFESTSARELALPGFWPVSSFDLLPGSTARLNIYKRMG